MEHTIWTEKYRPQTFSEIKGQDSIVSRLKHLVEKKNLPHVMFAGPAGIGKTTLSLVIAKEMFGDDWKRNFLELNASDERGIDVIRNQVKNFARTKALGDVPFKIIYLDECDALTKEAQQALRRTMENYTHSTRFILSCNYSSKIIDPIQSRCAIFRFKPLDEGAMKELITLIAKEEGFSVTEDGEAALVEVSQGDVRRLENLLQAAASDSNKVDEKVVYNVASFARPKEVGEMLSLAVKADFKGAKRLLMKIMLDYGLSGLDVIKQIQQEAWKTDLEDRQKLELVKLTGEAEFRMVEGADEFVQLEALLASAALLP
ncbi:replication factor C small subunit [Candidatus Woesearchaeota archaeon]|nr:replication factor C small subunit [Candidatus Woesearchaeota archaeon]